jgi:hypothetical protein
MNPEALDRWITGGDPHYQLCELECPDCGHQWEAEVLVEYGGVVDEPACPDCMREMLLGENLED